MEARNRKGSSLWAGAALGLLLAARASAIEVNPGFVARELVPGRLETQRLAFTTRLPVEKVVVQPVDFSIDRRGQYVVGELRDKKYSGKSWCRLKPTPVVATAGREVALDVPLQAPAGTPSGEFYLALQVLVHDRELPAAQGLQAKMEVSLLVIFVLKIAGGLPRIAGEVVEPQVTVQGSIPEFQAAFQSLCTVAVVVRSAVTVRDAQGRVADRVLLMGAGTTAEDGQVFMLPESLRDFAGQGNRKLPPGRYSAEIFSVFGKNHVRAAKTVDFEVQGGPVAPVPPLDEIQVKPERTVIEIPAGAVKFATVELKNRGFNAVDVSFAADREGLSFTPRTLRLEPGRRVKLRVGIRVPATENPRRDVLVRMVLEGAAEKQERPLTVAVYAPGTTPARKD